MTESFQQGEVVLIPPAIPHEWRFDPAITDSDGNIANISVFFENHIMESMGDLFPEIAVPLTKIRSLGHAVFYTGETLREISCTMLSMREMPPEKKIAPDDRPAAFDLRHIGKPVCRQRNPLKPHRTEA